MDALRFYLKIISAEPTGPLTSVPYWRYTAKMDSAGTIEFEVSASDPQVQHLHNLSEVRAYALLGETWTEVGAGIVDNIQKVVNGDGTVTLRCRGLDLIGELNTRCVRDLEIGSPDGTTLAAALSILNAFAPSGWSFNANSIPSTDFVYTRFDGESMLGALIYIAQKTGMHFYRIPARQLEFTNGFDDSGLTIVPEGGDTNDFTCTATVLDRTVDTHDLQTRMYGYASGEDRESSLTMVASDRVMPAGYTFNAAENYVQNDVAVALYGIRDFPEAQFKDITTISNTDADYVSAANLLVDSVLATLQERSTLDEQIKINLALHNCKQLLRPLQTARLLWYQPDADIDFNDDLYILESTVEWNNSDIHTTGLVVSTHDRWPKSSADHAAARAIQGKVFAGHRQISVNEWESHKEMLIGDSQTDHIGVFPFYFSAALVQILQVFLRFKVEQVLTVGYRYTLASDTNQNIAANTGATAAATTDQNSAANTGNTAPAATDANATPTVTGNTAPAATDANATPTVTGNTAPATTDVNIAANTGNNDVAAFPHVHPMGTHSHNQSTTHFHTIATHTHNQSTTHFHTIATHTHNQSTTHFHTSPQHTHTSTATHLHTSPQHTHPLTSALTETFGLVRVPALTTYAMSDLEYAVNGGAWQPLSGATDVSGGYFQIDLTEDVTSDTIPFRPAQTSGNNVVEIRRTTAAGTGKAAQVQAILYVRNTIQGVVLSP